jgi:hypothetical protein
MSGGAAGRMTAVLRLFHFPIVFAAMLPPEITIEVGQRVTFVDNDSGARIIIR